jgi:hypothetical protein
MLGDQVFYFGDSLSNTEWAHLFVVADHYGAFSEIKGKQTHDITLARLIDDDHVKPSRSWIERLRNAGQGHNPDWYGVSSFS